MRLRHVLLPALVVAIALLAWSSAVSAASQDDQGTRMQPGHPTSVESAVERRREAMDRRREYYLDWRTGRRWHQPPWVNAQRDGQQAREDVTRERMRQRHDAVEAWHDQVGRWRHPWSQRQQDWNRARRDARELERLSRDEDLQRFRYGPGFAPWGRPY